MAAKQGRWVVPPSGPEGTAVRIVVGPEEITPERQRELEKMARDLEQASPEATPINCPIVTVQTCEILILCTGVTSA